MAIKTSAGTQVYIGPATKADTVSALAVLSYVEIKKVESLGDIGPESQDVTFTPLGGEDVQHLKGATDNGTTVLIVGREPLDPGQIALKAASLTKLEYALKIVIPDADDANDTDTTIYVRGPVMGGRLNIGGANDVTKATYGVGNNVYLQTDSVAVSGP